MKCRTVNVKGYKRFNLGDDLFFSVLFKRYPNVKFVFCGAKEYKRIFKNYNNVVCIPPYSFKDILIEIINKTVIKSDFDFISYISDCEVLITGSGFKQQAESEIAKENIYKNKEFILGVNFGPYYEESYLNSWNDYFSNCKDVCFRDKVSYELFNSSGNVRYAPDIVFGFEKYYPDLDSKPCSFLEKIQFYRKEFAIISVISCAHRTQNSEKASAYYEGIKKIAEYLINKGLKVLFFSFCKREGDLDAIEEMLRDKHIAENASYYSYEGDLEEALNIISKSDTVIATRFHAMVLGMTMGKKVLPIVYDKKVANVLSDLQWKNLYCDAYKLNELTSSQLEMWYENYIFQDFSNEKNLSENHFMKLDDFLGKPKE